MDNHADTHCFGKNFIILEYTCQQCSVAEYDKTQNIDIVTGATAVDLEDVEEQRTKHDWSWEHSKLDLPLHHLVSLVERPNGVQVPVFRDDTFISEFDRGLCHASSGLAQDLAVDSLVNSAKVQLKDSARIALASTEKQHHEVTKELLAKKWGISVSRAEATLKASISYQCDLLSCL